MNMSPTQQQQQIAEQLKEEGNKLFSMGKYQPAVDKYTEAITIVPSWTVPLVNRALCYKKLQKWDKVEEDAITALSNAENMKAHYLLGQALIQKQLFTEASKNLKKALELAREKGDSIKDDIWRELARAEYKAWQQASSARKAKLDRLKDRLKKGLALLHLEEENADMDVDKGESTQDEEDLEWLLSCAQERDEPEEPASGTNRRNFQIVITCIVWQAQKPEHKLNTFVNLNIFIFSRIGLRQLKELVIEMRWNISIVLWLGALCLLVNAKESITNFWVGGATRQVCQTTKGGCHCKRQWPYEGQLYSGCQRPDNDVFGSWCIIDQDCQFDKTNELYKVITADGVETGDYWQYCSSYYCPHGTGVKPGKGTMRTLAGCACQQSWSYAIGGVVYDGFTGCANPDNDEQGEWCIVDPDSCVSTPQGNDQALFPKNTTQMWDHCQYKTAAKVSNAAGQPKSSQVAGDGSVQHPHNNQTMDDDCDPASVPLCMRR
eukprot:TRINITY_DN6404_c0_g1_i3.p1 TRINITY_DN6404_c0_g1~~TRINITY_DN6404_c0_g1_i3.p1  ORF type:complete len:491 (-),score=68.05 TRINITY_DN6404_c0_g1_i3:623-2095(-)